jgi:hypothetical protein
MISLPQGFIPVGEYVRGIGFVPEDELGLPDGFVPESAIRGVGPQAPTISIDPIFDIEEQLGFDPNVNIRAAGPQAPLMHSDPIFDVGIDTTKNIRAVGPDATLVHADPVFDSGIDTTKDLSSADDFLAENPDGTFEEFRSFETQKLTKKSKQPLSKIGEKIKFIRYGSPVQYSKNYITGEKYAGMSVYELNEDGSSKTTIRGEFSDRKDVYVGEGTIVAYGDDGEPIVQNYTVKKASQEQDDKAVLLGMERKEWDGRREALISQFNEAKAKKGK